MKACRTLLLCLMASAACLPASGMSPAQTVVANPDPQLTGPGLSSPFVARETPARSTSELAPSPAMSSGKKKTVLIVVAAVAVAVLVIVLASGGNSTGGGY